MSKTYKIGVEYKVYGYIYVDAESIEDAIDIAKTDEDIALPNDTSYIDDSWEVDEESAYFLNSSIDTPSK